jgi:hypothetical protein
LIFQRIIAQIPRKCKYNFKIEHEKARAGDPWGF